MRIPFTQINLRQLTAIRFRREAALFRGKDYPKTHTGFMDYLLDLHRREEAVKTFWEKGGNNEK